MDHADARELLEVAAVEPGGLARLMAGDTPEAAALAGHLAGCDECTQEMARLRRVAGIVRGVVRTTPPPELREQTLAFVRAVGRSRSGAPGALAAISPGGAVASPALSHAEATNRERDRATPPTRRWRGLAAIAAVVALAVAGTGIAVVQSQQQAEAVRDLATVTAWTVRVNAQPDARHVALAATGASSERATLFFSPTTRELVVVATGLNEPPAGQEFRCWLEAGGVRQGVGKMFFGGGVAYWVGPVAAVAGLSGHATFGVSLVNVGGSAAGAPPVLVGSL
jgi:anti-sigma-K factor RskA